MNNPRATIENATTKLHDSLIEALDCLKEISENPHNLNTKELQALALTGLLDINEILKKD